MLLRNALTSLGLIAILAVPHSSRAAVSLPTGFTDETILGGLWEPTDFAFLPDGRVLFTEQRTGRVRLIANGHIALTDPTLTVPNLFPSGNERGLLAIAVDPGWPARPYVYLYYDRVGFENRLVRYTASGTLSDPTAEDLTLADPYLIIDDIMDSAFNHNGGALHFGPDGMLFLSIGEDADPCAAQDSTTLKGEILRLKVYELPAGAGGPPARAEITPADNPLVTTNANAKLVWAYGLRNPFRFHIDSTTGILYVADVGQDVWEEMDEVEAGDNLGWPWHEGPAPYTALGCIEPTGSGPREPIASYSHADGTAIISAGIYRPNGGPAVWPNIYWGDVFFADYYTGFVRRLKKIGTWAPSPAPGQPNLDDWAAGLSSPVQFRVGPDGSLWWMSQFSSGGGSSTGSLHRIRWTGAPAAVGEAPAARALTAAPSPFVSRTTIAFALSASAPVRLSIYDVSGREIRRLMDGTAAAGPTHLVWDGADAGGHPVRAGVYLVRLDRAGSREATRVLRLR